MKYLIHLTILIFTSSLAQAQFYFERAVYPGAGTLYPSSIAACTDMGYILADQDWDGYSNIIKLDSLGNIEWADQIISDIANGVYYYINNVGEVPGTGYYVNYNFHGGGTYFSFLDYSGNLLYSFEVNCYQDTSPGNIRPFKKINSSGIIDLLIPDSTLHPLLMKIDLTGNAIWSKRVTYDTLSTSPEGKTASANDGSMSLVQPLSGQLFNLIKLDSLGNLVSAIKLTTNTGITIEDIACTNDEGYIISGMRGTSPLIMRLDSTCNLIWIRQYQNATRFNKITVMQNGNFLLDRYDYPSGITIIDSVGYEIASLGMLPEFSYLTSCIDANDEPVIAMLFPWTFTFMMDFVAKPDSLLMLSCPAIFSQPNIMHTNSSVNVVKSPGQAFINNYPVQQATISTAFIPFGYQSTDFCSFLPVRENPVTQNGFYIFPNPQQAGEEVQFILPDAAGVCSIVIRNCEGKMVAQTTGTGKSSISTKGFSPGIYFMQVADEKGEILPGRKFILE